MKRLPDWEANLSAYLASVYERPHEFGQHDCVLHGASAVAALTGEDRAAPFRGTYSTAFGAMRALKRLGHDVPEQLFDAHLPALPVGLAQRGDIVLAGSAIGVCFGGDALFVGQEGERQGLVRRPRAEWSKAWAVGR